MSTPLLINPKRNLESFSRLDRKWKGILSAGQTVINVLYTFFTLEPLSVPSEEAIAVQLGVLIKPLADHFQVIFTKFSAAGR